MSNDPYPGYERAVDELLKHLGTEHPDYNTVLGYQARLLENIYNTRRHNDTDIMRAERAEILEYLQKIALRVGVDLSKITDFPTINVPISPKKEGPVAKQQEFNMLLQALRGAVTRPESYNAQWSKITASLLHTAQMLEAWGYVLQSMSKRPNFETLNDLITFVDNLGKELRNLDAWLASQVENHWASLRASIMNARTYKWPAKKQAALSTYFREFSARTSSKRDISLPMRVEAQRFIAGEALVEYAHALREAVASSEAVRKAEE